MRKSRFAFLRGGAAREAGDAVVARAIDRMGEDQVRGAIRVVAIGNLSQPHQFGRQGHHQGSFRGVGVPVFRVGKKFGANARADFGHIADARPARRRNGCG